MRKLLNIILLTAGFALLWGCDEYDDGQLRKNIDAIEQELTVAEKRVAELNDEMNSLTASSPTSNRTTRAITSSATAITAAKRKPSPSPRRRTW